MILVCGEALVDLMVANHAGNGPTIDARMGGAPFNLAIGLARLGIRSAFFGGLSTDPLGEALAATLRREGVDLACVERSDANSMLAVVGIGPDGQPRYAFPIEDGADKRLPPAKRALVWGSGLEAATFGSYMALCGTTAPVLRGLAERLRPEAVIVLDPNVRLSIVRDRTAWRQGLGAFLPTTDIVKVSHEDITAIHGPEASCEVVARDWLERGPSIVCVTYGAGGASAYLRGRPAIVVAAPAVSVVDTVGAGDAFLAGLLASLSGAGALTRAAVTTPDPAVVARALHGAVAAAAFTCRRRGADLPCHSDLLGRGA